jgi:hypothetical protein
MKSASKQSAGETSGEKSLNNWNFSPGTIRLEGLLFASGFCYWWKKVSTLLIRVDRGC